MAEDSAILEDAADALFHVVEPAPIFDRALLAASLAAAAIDDAVLALSQIVDLAAILLDASDPFAAAVEAAPAFTIALEAISLAAAATVEAAEALDSASEAKLEAEAAA